MSELWHRLNDRATMLACSFRFFIITMMEQIAGFPLATSQEKDATYHTDRVRIVHSSYE